MRKWLVLVVVLTASLVFTGVSWGAGGAPSPPPPGPAPGSGPAAGSGAGSGSGGAVAYDPAADPYSMYNLTAQMGVPAWWNAGYTGKGVDVALIDTGVSPVAGLDGPNKVVYGPDLSLESQFPSLVNLDTNGHGTFMAGLIAGHDSTLTAPYSSAPASAYRGIAPDARIISLKVAAADGAVDVSQVIAAIDWVVQNAHDPGLDIRVINLSYGTDSTQPYAVDPLAYAVEQAWKHGIVVVAAAGNTGYQHGNGVGLSDPAYDPFVIAAGAYNTMGTSDIKDDVVASYSAGSTGCKGCKNPDLLAPGSHLQGLRVPNSYVDANNPSGRINDRYFRGSGTSEATAITSGVVALLLQKYPDLTPDEVKKLLTDSAQKVPGANPHIEGSGEINLSKLATAKDPNGPGPFCVGTYSGTTGNDLEVLSGTTCTLTAQARIGHDVKVDQGGTLIDQGATIGHDVHANQPAGIEISGGSIANNVQVQNATGDVTIENATIGHDLQVQNNQGSVTVEGDTVNHDLRVQKNQGTATVDNNTVANHVQVQDNGAAGPGPGPGPGSGPVPPGRDAQNFPFSTGTGSLELSRGSNHLSHNGVELTGNEDIFGNPFNPAGLAQAEAAGSSWSGGKWEGSSWSGGSWDGSSWSGSSWSGSSWSGSSWSGSSWSGSSWSGSSWSGSSWSGSSWSGSSWSGDVWASAGWG